MFAEFLAMNPSGFLRLVGHYRGPMFFYDEFEKKDKSFQIDMRIEAKPDCNVWTVKHRYSPPQYQLEFLTTSVTENGSKYTERSLQEKFYFKLTNWEAFSKSESNWYEIERTQLSSEGPRLFRRRYTLKPNGDLWSEKWLKKPEQNEWVFSHRMELKKISK